jgi:hypothetical protein
MNRTKIAMSVVNINCIYFVYLPRYRQYTCIVGKYIIDLHEFQKQVEKQAFGEHICSVSQRVQMNYIFSRYCTYIVYLLNNT